MTNYKEKAWTQLQIIQIMQRTSLHLWKSQVISIPQLQWVSRKTPFWITMFSLQGKCSFPPPAPTQPYETWALNTRTLCHKCWRASPDTHNSPALLCTHRPVLSPTPYEIPRVFKEGADMAASCTPDFHRSHLTLTLQTASTLKKTPRSSSGLPITVLPPISIPFSLCRLIDTNSWFKVCSTYV